MNGDWLWGWIAQKGGRGSGNYGHRGAPGHGGSSAGTGVNYSQSTPGELNDAVDRNLDPEYEGYVTRYTDEEYDELDAKCYVSSTGKSCYALQPDGEIMSVISGGGGEGREAMTHAIIRGGWKLYCFEGGLTEFYDQFRFKEVGRVPFDDKLAHAKWNYKKHNRPDLVFMELPEELRR